MRSAAILLLTLLLFSFSLVTAQQQATTAATNNNQDSSSNVDPFLLIRTRMHLTGEKFQCKHQVSTCFITRFKECFSSGNAKWFDPEKLTVSVYQFALPYNAANMSQALYVTILMQLLSTETKKPDSAASTALVATKKTQCASVGFEGGFELLGAWIEPPALGEELDENISGIGLSFLFAFIPCAMVSLNVFRRWRKIARSDENYKKLLLSMQNAEEEEVGGSGSSTSVNKDKDANNNNNSSSSNSEKRKGSSSSGESDSSSKPSAAAEPIIVDLPASSTSVVNVGSPTAAAAAADEQEMKDKEPVVVEAEAPALLGARFADI